MYIQTCIAHVAVCVRISALRAHTHEFAHARIYAHPRELRTHTEMCLLCGCPTPSSGGYRQSGCISWYQCCPQGRPRPARQGGWAGTRTARPATKFFVPAGKEGAQVQHAVASSYASANGFPFDFRLRPKPYRLNSICNQHTAMNGFRR